MTNQRSDGATKRWDRPRFPFWDNRMDAYIMALSIFSAFVRETTSCQHSAIKVDYGDLWNPELKECKKETRKSSTMILTAPDRSSRANHIANANVCTRAEWMNI